MGDWLPVQLPYQLLYGQEPQWVQSLWNLPEQLLQLRLLQQLPPAHLRWGGVPRTGAPFWTAVAYLEMLPGWVAAD